MLYSVFICLKSVVHFICKAFSNTTIVIRVLHLSKIHQKYWLYIILLSFHFFFLHLQIENKIFNSNIKVSQVILYCNIVIRKTAVSKTRYNGLI